MPNDREYSGLSNDTRENAVRNFFDVWHIFQIFLKLFFLAYFFEFSRKKIFSNFFLRFFLFSPKNVLRKYLRGFSDVFLLVCIYLSPYRDL